MIAQKHFCLRLLSHHFWAREFSMFFAQAKNEVFGRSQPECGKRSFVGIHGNQAAIEQQNKAQEYFEQTLGTLVGDLKNLTNRASANR
jgi:hypothetical protein